jgi:hypothetical protein
MFLKLYREPTQVHFTFLTPRGQLIFPVAIPAQVGIVKRRVLNHPKERRLELEPAVDYSALLVTEGTVQTLLI